MDIFLAILSGVLIFLGILGSLLPVLPGTPLAWLGILLLHFTKYADFSFTFWIIFTLVMLLISVLDYFIPIWGTKHFGGTKAGVYGATIGLIVGLFLGPVGIVAGPFIGAFIGELIVNRRDVNRALKSATGSFIGFLLGIGLKLTFCGFAIYYYIQAVFT